MGLNHYWEKRNFKVTSEPSGKKKTTTRKKAKKPIFVIQEHHASRLHYDFRLEEEGVLKSWAVTKEPSMDPQVRRLAIEVEDHPLEYAKFHGDIPRGEYGAGHVEIWDRGTFENVSKYAGDPISLSEAIDAGHIDIMLHGEKLSGHFTLVRLKTSERQPSWLLIKAKHAPKLSAVERAKLWTSKKKKTAA